MNNEENLNRFADYLQIFSFILNVSQTSNDKLMKELANQDKILDEQTNIYFKKIIEQNQEIINLLKGENK